MTRRANHEGSTPRPHKRGGYVASVMLRGQRKSFYGKTKRDVQQKVRQAVADSERGLQPFAERVTLAAYLARWLEDVIKPHGDDRSIRTYEVYAYHIRCHINPTLGSIQLRRLQALQIQRLLTALLQSGLSPKTVKNVHGVLRSALGQAVRWQLVPANVAQGVTPPRARPPERRTLSADEVKRLWAAAAGTRWAPLLVLTAATGLRQGEVLGLQWSDIDFARRTLRCQRQLQRDKSLRAPKNQGRRPLDLAEPEVELLREHRRAQDELRLAQGPRWEAHDLVFCTDRGRPLGHRNVSREFKKFVARAGLPDIRFHDLRHSNATLLAAAGVPLKVIQERLGHTDSRTTLGFYGHTTPAMGKEAAQKLRELLHDA